MNKKRLEMHYNEKYKNGNSASVSGIKPVPFSPFPVNRFEMAVKLASQNSGGRYLEIGAGSGNTLSSVINYYDELVATELSIERVKYMEKAFSNFHDNIKIICHDIEEKNLPYPDNYFDTISMIAVIEHLIDPIVVLKEIKRLLKPNGRLIIDTPNIAKWTRRLKLLFGYFPSTASLQEGLLCYDKKNGTDLHDEGHLHYFTFRSLSRICVERAGFSKVKIYGYGGNFFYRAWPQLFSDISIIAYK